MKKKLLSVVVVPACLALMVSGQAAALTITTTSDANVLASNILGSGITFTGVSSYTGGANAAGTFTDGLASGIGIDKGIILTSGNANIAVGPNDSDFAGQDNGGAGFASLDALVPGYTTYDGTRLSLLFTSGSGDVFFKYAFASEEYNEWVGSLYNDVFGFFLDGVNIAVLPDGDPVAINHLNCGYSSNAPGGYPGAGPHCDAYNNNDLSEGGPFYDIQYDGFTNVLVAKFLGLTPGEHSLQLDIADAGDHAYDSAVFIQAGSLSSVPEPVSLALMGIGLAGLAAARRRKQMA